MSLVDDFVQNAQAVGVIVHRGEPPSIDGAGVSRALYGLADTGSVVLAASPDEPRARSLLPAVHVTLLAEDQDHVVVSGAITDKDEVAVSGISALRGILLRLGAG